MKYGEMQQYYRAKPKPREAKKYCHCGKVALYLAGGKAWCWDHKSEADAAAKQAARRIY